MVTSSITHQAHIVEILPLGSKSDLTAAADVLAEAFMYGNPDKTNPHSRGVADPFYNRRNYGDEKVHRLFHSIINLASSKNHTISVIRNQEKRIVGVSWVKERGVRDLNIFDSRKLIMPAYRAFGFVGTFWYCWDIIRHLPDCSIDETYISMVGVDKSSQGKGIGKALINHAVDRAAKRDVMLSTMNPSNVELYQKLGFVLKPEKQTKAGDCKHRPGFTTYHMVYKG